MWIIGDVAGEFNALGRLLSKLPGEDKEYVFVGDLNDRGPNTPEVIDFIKSNGYVSLMGNHEHMFIDYIMSRHNKNYSNMYSTDDFLRNGGIATLKSYLEEDWLGWRPSKKTAKVLEHIEWLKERPLKFETDNLIVTHAPIKNGDIEQFNKTSVDDAVWNRDHIKPNDKKFQIFGHNGHLRLFSYQSNDVFVGEQIYAICVDDSRNGNLTAIHWPSLEIIQEKY